MSKRARERTERTEDPNTFLPYMYSAVVVIQDSMILYLYS
jgi:hypothetical protein